MKVGIVVPYSWSFWGGVQEHADHQARALGRLGVDARIHAVDEARRVSVRLESPVPPPPEEEELELVSADDAQVERLSLCNGALQDPARGSRKGCPVEPAIPDADRGLALPGHDPKRLESREDLHVPEAELVAHPGPVGHDPGVVDGEDGDAELEPCIHRLLEEPDRNDLGSGRSEQVGVVHANALDASCEELLETFVGGLLLLYRHDL